ncbi:hypothetical protein [Gelidibacter maritimus]|uniref:Outer membrane protein beta-barrel domain-containing protein n=1 Tax=Gelidibacter maritimus TaxID=2761487 RepID=A0A7W2R3F3_9FLAO|nr:hypothetical protein [Gelidibacter maritimus]MBA6152787.1 hypothetical protein [Gelidibacter maritimus]
MLKKINSPLIGALLLLFTLKGNSQNGTGSTRYTATNKGKVFVSWGGNRAAYTKSDITFKGEDYEFTIKDATANDKPKGWHIDYINPARITIPQTNFKLGYFFSDKYSLALGVDHMKYIMTMDNNRVVDGYIDLPADDVGSIYNGVYDQQNFFVSKEFLRFEHTDGLNYVYLELARRDDISSLFNIQNTDKFQINITEGIGAGILYPKTNTTLFDRDRYDEFHVSGYGLSLGAGLNFTFFKHFFIQGDLRGGYINMGNIRTTRNPSEGASQHFFFGESVFNLGGIFRI